MSKYDLELVKDRSRGQWQTIYAAAGIQFKGKPSKHQPCPACGGTDRFRMDDRTHMGDWICNNCGAGDGFALLQNVMSCGFTESLKFVAGVLGVSEETTFTPEQRAKAQAKAQEAERKRVAKQNQQYADAAREAQTLWAGLPAAPADHAYLVRKGIKPHVAKLHDDMIIVPFFHPDHGMTGYQRIQANGTKKNQFGMRQTGSFCIIGRNKKGIETPVIAVCEGYATAASVHEALNIPAAVTISTNNIIPACENLRRLYPNVKFIFCADNDMATATKLRQRDIEEGKKPKMLDEYNPGIKAANAAALKLGGFVVVPDALPVKESKEAA